MNQTSKKRSPWAWIPSLYFAQGIPYVAVMTISVIMYKKLDISNTDIALYTSWLYLPWVIKPLWSPFVDMFKTKRWWITTMQILVGAGLAGIAFVVPAPFFFQATLAFFWIVAFSSATHDIAADGFYLLALEPHEQAMYVGIRSTFYRIASILGQGILIILAGMLETKTGNIKFAWSCTFFVMAGLFICFFLYHNFILPKPKTDHSTPNITFKNMSNEFIATFVSFFQKKQVAAGIFFMLTYRFAEAQLLKLVTPFLLDPRDKGGLGLMTEEVGIVYGTIGIICLTVGGIIGGIVASRGGLKKWLWPMALSMILTAATFMYLAYFQPTSFIMVNICVGLEQFGYGFGFTAYMMYLMYYSEGEHKTSHYAICTAFMALGMMLPGMAAGWIQEQLGYERFFEYVMLCSIVPLIATALLKIDPNYGKNTKQKNEK